MILKSLWNTIKNFLDDDPMSSAASLAFYMVVSMPAILLIAINVLSLAYEQNQIQQDLLHQMSRYLGPNTVDQATTILDNASTDVEGVFPQIIGYLLLFFSATTVFISLQDGVNKIWKTPNNKTRNGFITAVVNRLLSFTMIISLGFILMVTLLLDSVLLIFDGWIKQNYSYFYAMAAWFLQAILTFSVTAFVFAVIFNVLPQKKIPWRISLVGALFSTVLFLIGKFAINAYLSMVDVGSAYGASSSFVVFLFWVYYSSVLALFGSKFTYEYYVLKKKSISPAINESSSNS